MKSTQPILIALLAVTTIGGATLAWRQYGELVELRAAAMNRDERADMQRRIWDLEKMNRELQDRLAARRPSLDAGEERVAGQEIESERRPGEREGRGGRGDFRGRGGDPMQQAAAIRELMNKPEVQAMMNLQQKAAIEARYAALFQTLNLSPDQAEKLKTLLAERGSTRMDVMAAATAQGIDPRENPEAYRKLFTDAQNEINASIKSVLGDSGYAQLQNYEQTLPQRALVTDLQQRLSYTNTPLSNSQAEALVQILAANQPTRSTSAGPGGPPTDMMQVQIMRGPGPGGPGGPPGRGGDFVSIGGPGLGPILGGMDGMRGPTVPVTSAAVTQAQSVLAPTQLAALQQIQQQQQAQQQLQQMVRETLSNSTSTPGGGRPSSGSTAPGGTTPARKGG